MTWSLVTCAWNSYYNYWSEVHLHTSYVVLCVVVTVQSIVSHIYLWHGLNLEIVIEEFSQTFFLWKIVTVNSPNSKLNFIR